MVSDSFEEETLLLNWVNPTELDRDEEEQQLMEHVPLAQWDPNGGLVLMTEEVFQCSEFTIVNSLCFFSIKLLLSIKKKKKD